MRTQRKAALTNAGQTGTAREYTLHCVDMLMQHLLCTADNGFYITSIREWNDHSQILVYNDSARIGCR